MKGKISEGINFLRRNSLRCSLIIVFLGASFMTVSIIIDGQKKTETLFEYENVIIGREDFRFVSRYLERTWKLSVSFEANATITVHLAQRGVLDQIFWGNLSNMEKNLDTLSLKGTNGSGTSVIRITDEYVFLFRNLNKTHSALVTQITCKAERLGIVAMGPLDLAHASPFFYLGLTLSLLGVAWFVVVELRA